MALSPQYGSPSPDATSGAGQDIVEKFKEQQLRQSMTPTLDPTKDLTPFERSLKDVLATSGATADKSAEYFTGPNLNKTCEDIVTEQFGPRAMVLDNAMNEIADQDKLSGVHGSVAYPSLGLTASEIDGPSQPVPDVYTPEYKATESQLQSELDRYPQYDLQPHKPESPNAGEIGLAVIMGLFAPGAIPQILDKMQGNAVEAAKFKDAMAQAQYAARVHGSDKVIAALQNKLRTQQMAGEAQARIAQSDINNQRTTTTSRQNTQDRIEGMATRQERSIRSKEEIAHMADATKRYVAGLKDPVEKVKALMGMGYTAEQARDMANSEDLNRLARTEKTKQETTYLQRSLDDRLNLVHSQQVNANLQSAYIKARTKYTNELIKYIPQTEALKWATLNALVDYRNRELGIKEDQYDSKLDTEVDPALQKGFDAAMEKADTLRGYLDSGYDEDGEPLTDGKDGQPNTRAAIEAKYNAATATAKRIEESMARAKKEREFSKAKTIEKRKLRLPSIGKRPPPMGGNVPIDPTGGQYDRVKNLGGSIKNDYL